MCNSKSISCVAESRRPREETRSSSLPLRRHVRNQSASWGNHLTAFILLKSLFINLFGMISSLDMIVYLFQMNVWDLGKVFVYSMSEYFFTLHLYMINFYLNITARVYSWSKQGVLIFTKQRNVSVPFYLEYKIYLLLWKCKREKKMVPLGQKENTKTSYGTLFLIFGACFDAFEQNGCTTHMCVACSTKPINETKISYLIISGVHI